MPSDYPYVWRWRVRPHDEYGWSHKGERCRVLARSIRPDSKAATLVLWPDRVRKIYREVPIVGGHRKKRNGHMNSVLIEFAYGERYVTSGNGLRRAQDHD